MQPVTPDTRDALALTVNRLVAAGHQLRIESRILHSLIRTLLHTEPFDWQALTSAQTRLNIVQERKVGIRTLLREAVGALNAPPPLNPTTPTTTPV